MVLDDAPAQRQAYAHARGLGGHERLEEARKNVLGEPRTRVGDLDLERTSFVFPGSHPDNLVRPFTDRFGGVAEKVDEHLLNLHPVDERRAGVLGDLHACFDPRETTAEQGEGDGVLHQVRKGNMGALAVAFADEITQASDHFARPDDLLGGATAAFGCPHQVAHLDGPTSAADEGGDRRQWLITISVSDGGASKMDEGFSPGLVERWSMIGER